MTTGVDVTLAMDATAMVNGPRESRAVTSVVQLRNNVSKVSGEFGKMMFEYSLLALFYSFIIIFVPLLWLRETACAPGFRG